MENASMLPEDCKIIPSAGRLIMHPADRDLRIMTEQQRPDGPVTDDEDISSRVSFQNHFHLPHNALLGSKSGLPTPNANGRGGEELARHIFEFGCWQVARRGAVVLVCRFLHSDGEAQSRRQDLCSLERLRFAAGYDLGGARKPPSLCKRLHTLATDRTQLPQRYGNARIDLHLRMGQIANAVLHRLGSALRSWPRTGLGINAEIGIAYC